MVICSTRGFFDNTWFLENGLVNEYPPYIVGLRVKGKLQCREMGEDDNAGAGDFFFSAKEAEERGSDPDFIMDTLRNSVGECFRQSRQLGRDPLSRLPVKEIYQRFIPEIAGEYAKMLRENA